MPDSVALRALVARVGEFYVRDRRLRRAQRAIEAALAAGEAEPALAATYLAEARRYFLAFDREAAAQLRRVDRELEALYARQFNMTAERGVAAKRAEATQGVLSALAELGRG
jgi:hypothetical protein